MAIKVDIGPFTTIQCRSNADYIPSAATVVLLFTRDRLLLLATT